MELEHVQPATQAVAAVAYPAAVAAEMEEAVPSAQANRDDSYEPWEGRNLD